MGRVGFVTSDGVQIEPVTYSSTGQRVFFPAAPESRLVKLAELGRHVTFEVDHHSNELGIAWTINMNGVIGMAGGSAVPEADRPDGEPIQLEFTPSTISGRVFARTEE